MYKPNRKELTLPKSGEKVTIREIGIYEILMDGKPMDLELVLGGFDMEKADAKTKKDVIQSRVEIACKAVVSGPDGKELFPDVPKKTPEGMISFFDLPTEDQTFLIAEAAAYSFGGVGGNAERFPKKPEAGSTGSSAG